MKERERSERRLDGHKVKSNKEGGMNDNDPTIEHFVLGQFVLYFPSTSLPPPPPSENEAKEHAPASSEHLQTSQQQASEEGEKADGAAGNDEETTEEGMNQKDEEGIEKEVAMDSSTEDVEAEVGVYTAPVAMSVPAGSESQNATIIGVHRDDFPNIYYTIRMEGSERERQTVAGRLTPRETREEAEARLIEIQRKKTEEDKRRHEAALEERARQEREAILKRKLEEKEKEHESDVNGNDRKDKSKEDKKSKKSISDKMAEKCQIS